MADEYTFTVHASDAELAVIEIIKTALTTAFPIDAVARKRILRYVNERFVEDGTTNDDSRYGSCPL